MIECLLIDLDDTILDFHQAEAVAIRKTLLSLGIDCTDHVCDRYSQINKACWEMLERKELTREQLLVQRFAMLLAEIGVPVDPVKCARCYEKNLSIGHYFMPGAFEALERLPKKYRLFLASNGTSSIQQGRLNSAGIKKYFEKIFISQDIGANKPSEEYFLRCFAQISNFDRKKCMIVGDSLTSDILGGIQAGIFTCWVNPEHKTGREDIRADYEIESLSQLEALLDAI